MEARDSDLRAMFEREVDRIRSSRMLGASGRVLELFNFLAARGPSSPAASQAELATSVFNQSESMADDATVRVYIHRLRKRLEEFYSAHGEGPDKVRLTLPPGSYALKLLSAEGEVQVIRAGREHRRPGWRLLVAVVALALLAGLLVGRLLPSDDAAPAANALWTPVLQDSRPILIVLGDYYMFGEIDSVSPESGRLIRDFSVNSPDELNLMRYLYPERYGSAEDFGINYLPFSAAYGLERIVPILSRGGRQVSVIASSDLNPDMLNYFNVVYVGLFSGMGMLQDETFSRSSLRIGDSFDELIDEQSNTTYVSEEARRATSGAHYRDYAYVSQFQTMSGAIVVVVASARDTGLRAIAPLLTRSKLPSEVAEAAKFEQYEALYQVTGQQGADLSERLLFARPRPN